MSRAALRKGGAAPTVLNAANEVAVRHFLDRGIGFLDIARVVEETLNATAYGRLANLDDVAEADEEARRIAKTLITKQQN